MSTFRIESIKATSDLALYIFTNGRRIAIPTTTRVLWGPNPSPNPVVVFNRDTLLLDVQCSFGSSFIGKTLTVEGLLNDRVAVSATVTVPSTGSALVQRFNYSDPNPYPLAYRGSFQWRLKQGNTVVATFPTPTNLEFYNRLPRDPRLLKLWSATGISVNLLRRYIPIRNTTTYAWNLAAFYKRITEDIFGGPFKYNNTSGSPRYVVDGPGKEDSYRLDQYFQELESGQAQLLNCADLAGIVQVVLSLFPNYNLVQWNFMRPYGWIKTTKLKGWPNDPCNNPFWGMSKYYNRPIAPVNYDATKLRSGFAVHVFISAPTSSGQRILDASSGPYIGLETLENYLEKAIDRTTDYYRHIPNSGPGTPADIVPGMLGITSFTPAASFATTHVLAGEAAATSSAVVESASAQGTPFAATENVLSAAIESSSLAESSSMYPVHSAMERAKVTNADPARLSCIDPITLKSVLQQISKSKLTFETVGLAESGSELQLGFGTFPDAVEVTLAIVDSHEAAVTRMRRSLTYTSAPLDAAPIPFGQYSLQDGDSCILFVRGNVFVKITRSASCVELGTIAAEVDRFLKEREGDLLSLSKPRVESSGAHDRVVKVGETFEVAVKVVYAGSMTAFTDVGIAQLLEVDAENGTFKFYATAAGVVDIRLVFAHKDTLQTTTATVRVEVVGDSSENERRLGELHV